MAADRRTAPLMPGDRVQTIDGRRGFAVGRDPIGHWRILLDDRRMIVEPPYRVRRELVAPDPWEAGHGR